MGSINEIAQSLIKISDVSEVYSVTGEWDLVAVVKMKNSERLPNLVTLEMLKIEGIEKTATLMAFQIYCKEDLEKIFSVGLENCESSEQIDPV